MEKVAKFVVKHKLIITSIFTVLCIVALICLFFVNINSDIISYLPDDMTTSEGYAFLQKNFNMESDAIMSIKGATYEQMEQIATKIQALEGMREQGVTWYGTLDGMLNMQVPPEFEDTLNNVMAEIKNNPDVIKLFRPTDDIYNIMLQMSVSTSSSEAGKILKESKAIVAEYGLEFAVGGSSEIATGLLSSALSEMPYFLVVAVIIVAIVLLATTNSFLEPVILLVTLIISILLNMGSNIIFKNVSVITFATSAILQLALSIDYSIFLIHAFSEEKTKCLDNRLAMQKAFSRTFSTICASSLTTIGGFLALICMKFGIGADLGIVLAKGVLMSLLTVLFLQPCIMLFLAKPMEKTKHPVYLPKFQKSANFAVKARKPIIVIFLIALIPVLYCGLNISYSYMKMDKGNKQPTEVEQIVEVMGNSILICAPNGKSADTHTKFIKDIKKFEEVEVVSSIYAMLPKDMPIVSDIMLKQVHQMIENNAPELKAYANNKYVLYTVMISTKSESKEEQLLLAKIQGVLTKHFGEDYYITGMAQAVNDLATITPKDFALVSVVSAVIIFIILMFTIKSFKYSLALMGVIEFGIYVNLGICFLANTPVNFMAYIIISSVQLGATIDYAILLAMEFKRKMQTMSIKTACASAVQNSSLPICISAIILSALCYAVSLISSNAIIGQITMLIANGAVISALLILFVLPSVLLAITHKVPKEIDFKQLIKRKKKQKKYNT